MWARSSWFPDLRRRPRRGARGPREPGREKMGSPVVLPTSLSHFILCHDALPSLPKRSLLMTASLP